MKITDNMRRASEIIASWPEWKRKITLTKYSQELKDMKSTDMSKLHLAKRVYFRDGSTLKVARTKKYDYNVVFDLMDDNCSGISSDWCFRNNGTYQGKCESYVKEYDIIAFDIDEFSPDSADAFAYAVDLAKKPDQTVELITIPKDIYDALVDSAEVEWNSLENLEPYYGKYRKDKSLYEALVFAGRIKL